MFKKLSPYIVFMAVFSNANACLNSYDEQMMELEPDPTSITFMSQTERNQFYQNELQKFLKKSPKPKTIEQKNDYAVQLIYNGEYTKAVKILLEIEKSKPNLANTAVNLGTAYELLRQNDQAAFWIAKGLKLNPDVHEGSEWIHLEILKAKQQKADAEWFRWHPLLALDFGTGYFPKLSEEKRTVWNIDQADRLAQEAKLQLRERRKFIFGDDIYMAQLAYETANVEILRGQSYEMKYKFGAKNEQAYRLATVAEQHKFEMGPNEQKRMKMLLSDSVLYRLYLKLFDAVGGIFKT